jgi:hypothetical protein
MANEDIDRILSREDEILPSSGFGAAVMEAVRSEAAAPPPIPFPWKRAWPGIVIGVGSLVLVLVAVVTAVVRSATEPITAEVVASMPSGMALLSHGGLQSAIVWTVLALLAAFVSVKACTRGV